MTGLRPAAMTSRLPRLPRPTRPTPTWSLPTSHHVSACSPIPYQPPQIMYRPNDRFNPSRLCSLPTPILRVVRRSIQLPSTPRRRRIARILLFHPFPLCYPTLSSSRLAAPRWRQRSVSSGDPRTQPTLSHCITGFNYPCSSVGGRWVACSAHTVRCGT